MPKVNSVSNRSSDWAKIDPTKVPNIIVKPPGPKSQQLHARCTKYFKGLSGQVK
ncbi:unnamed protein product, partial [marine sediment metagenome]